MPDVGGLIEMIYAAAAGEIAWFEALDALRQHVGAIYAALFHLDTTGATPSEMVTMCGYPDGSAASYEQHYSAVNTAGQADYPMAPGDLYIDDKQLAFAEIQETDRFQDFLRPIGAGRCVALRPAAGNGRAIFLTMQRPLDGGAFNQQHIHTLCTLRPHLLRALHLGRKVREATVLAQGLVAGLDRFPTPVLLVQATGAVIEANAAAFALLSRDGCPLILLNGALTARQTAVAEDLQRAISAAAAGGSPVPIQRLPDSAGMPIGLMMENLGAHVLVFIADPGAVARIDPALLRVLFGLSPAESQIVLLIAAGARLAAVATIRGVSVETVRVQLKVAMVKLRVTSQAQLASLATRLAYLPGTTKPRTSTPSPAPNPMLDARPSANGRQQPA